MITIQDIAPQWAKLLVTEINRDLSRLRNPSPKPIFLASFTVANLPSASDFINAMIIVSDETGGSIPAFSDGTNWRRVTDRAVVS